MIKIENLVHKYVSENNETTAVNDLSLKINEGEFLTIIGHNGSGKSTLARHLNAILSPTSGFVWVDEISTLENEQVWNIRQKVGMVFQNPDNQLIATTVEEDVAFGLENIGVPSNEIRERIDIALDSVGMKDFSKREPHYLSGGQKQRVSIAGIIAMKPKYLVLDEPTAMLDPLGREEVISTIRRLNKEEGLTVILITHFMEEAVYADRVVILENGEIVLKGDPRMVFAEIDKLKQLALDIPVITELAVLLNREIPAIPGSILTIEEMVKELCP